MVKFPDPLHPAVTPLNVHDPVMVLLLSIPVMVSTLPLGFEDCTVNSKLPEVIPLVLPLNIRPPVSDEVDTKHGVAVVKVKFAPVIVVPLLSFKVVVNENAAVPSVLVRVALQFPLTLFELPPPHANNTNNIEQSTAIAKCRIINSFGGKNPFACGKLLIVGNGEVCITGQQFLGVARVSIATAGEACKRMRIQGFLRCSVIDSGWL